MLRSIVCGALLAVPVVAWGDAEPASRPASPPASRPAADPPPLTTARALDVTLCWQDGGFTVLSKRTVDLGAPRRLPRYHGRFSAELYDASHGLLDRVRFDFPLLADTWRPDGAPGDVLNDITDHARSRVTVRLPLDPRVATLEIHDGHTGRWLAFSAAPTPVSQPTAAPPTAAAPGRR